MKRIGKSFYDELLAYGGLLGEHFTWQENGTIEFFDDTPEAVVAGVKAVYEAHNPDTISMAEALEKVDKLMADANEQTAGMADAFMLGLLSEEEEAFFRAWAAYKLALKKVPRQSGFPQSAEWPVIPSAQH